MNRAMAPSSSWIPLVLILVICASLASVYWDGLAWMVKKWERDEYSHGYLVPPIALFLMWMHIEKLETRRLMGSWWGPIFVIAALAAFLFGELSCIYQDVNYGFLLALFGVILATVGWKGFGLLWVPFVFLFFMVPLPAAIYHELSSALQLISSELGVAIIRLFGISVFLEGNVIDLGTYKMQVVEAVAGLRYLFPVMSFGFLCAAIFEAPRWQRCIVFLSSIPITILMNSFRIGVIGLLFNFYGIKQADAFFHDFEGWVVFMVCIAILLLEMWVFAKLAGKPLKAAFDITIPPIDNLELFLPRRAGGPLVSSAVILLLGAVLALSIQGRQVQIPERETFATFPLELGKWRGVAGELLFQGLSEFWAKDFLLVDYRHTENGSAVGLWIAYDEEQHKCRTVPSPRTSLLGGGWRIESFDQHLLSDYGDAGQNVTVNRAVIAAGEERQLVYYWFVERGRIQTNRNAVKWGIFWDALTLNRTDGALVRVTTNVPDVALLDEADEYLADFVRELAPQLKRYLPGREARLVAPAEGAQTAEL